MTWRAVTVSRFGAGVLAASLCFLSVAVGSASLASTPTAITGPVTAYGPTSATVVGTVGPNGETTTWYFEYGKSVAYGTRTTSVNAGSGATNGDISATLSSLEPGTTYHYRLVAMNSSGTSRGADGIVTTSAIPAVVTGDATNITTTSATLAGSVNPNGRATTWYFEYGTSTGYGTKTPNQSAGAGTSTVNVSVPVSDLRTGSTYHFRLVATSDAGASRGSDRSFTVAAAPSVSTSAATSVLASSARLNGRLTPNGQTATWYFEYGTSTSYGKRTPERNGGSGTSSSSVSVSISGLAVGATYHYRLVARNTSGTGVANDQTFTTNGPPLVVTGRAQSVATTAVTLTGSVDPRGRSTSWHFELGPNTGYGVKTASTNAGSGNGAVPVSAALASLAPGTTYHYRLVASNSAGTTSGADATFTTVQALTLRTGGLRVVAGRHVTLSGTFFGAAAGAPVMVLAQPFGSGAPSEVAKVSTGGGGMWTYLAQPKIATTYRVSANGGTSGSVTVGVRPAISLRPISKARFSTKVMAAAGFAGKLVKLQRLSNGKWVTVKQARLNASSVAIFSANLLPQGRSTIRVAMSVNQAGPGYLGGFSRTIIYRH